MEEPALKTEEEGYSIDDPLFWVSDKDYVTFRHGSWFVTGSTGSGKSSTVNQALYKSMLAAGYSAFVTVTKREDKDDYIKAAKEVGRGDDVVIVGEGKHSLNIFSQEAAATANPIDIPSNITAFAEQVIEINSGSGLEKDFFVFAALELFSNSCGLLVDSNEDITLANIDRVIHTAATSESILDDPSFQNEAYCGRLLIKALQRKPTMSHVEARQFERRQNYFANTFVTMAPETQSSVKSTYSAYFSQLLQGSARELLLADKPTISPEEVFLKNKIIIIDAPCKVLGFSAQALTKICITFFLKMRERLAIPRNSQGNLLIAPFAMFIDEYQLYISPSAHPSLFSTIRSSGTCVIALTQSLSSLYEQLDSRKAKYQANSIISNLPCRLALNINDFFTAEEYSNSIGKTFTRRHNFNFGRNFNNPATGGGAHVGSSFHEEYIPLVPAIEFSMLQKASPETGFAETIHWNHGRIFSNGKNHIRVAFNFEGEALAMESVETSGAAPNASILFLGNSGREILRPQVVPQKWHFSSKIPVSNGDISIYLFFFIAMAYS